MGLALGVMGILIVLPLANVFYQALAKGVRVYWDNLFGNANTRHAILLTMTVAPVAVAMNLVFGVSAAWLIARYRFRGRGFHDLNRPAVFGVSGGWRGLSLCCCSVCKDIWELVARSRLPHHLSAAGTGTGNGIRDISVRGPRANPDPGSHRHRGGTGSQKSGASGWQMFWRITLPNIKWGVLYGVILCNARAMGEFGAVYVVSGHITGQTDTMPLRVEKLFQEYNSPASFALASVLTLLALLTLFVKVAIEHKARPQQSKEEPSGGGFQPS